MALNPINVICTSCDYQFKDRPERSFLGFQKITCPSCQNKLIYPLTSGFRTTYLIIAILMLLMIIANLSKGNIGSPGVIGFAILYALIRDWQIRKEISNA